MRTDGLLVEGAARRVLTVEACGRVVPPPAAAAPADAGGDRRRIRRRPGGLRGAASRIVAATARVGALAGLVTVVPWLVGGTPDAVRPAITAAALILVACRRRAPEVDAALPLLALAALALVALVPLPRAAALSAAAPVAERWAWQRAAVDPGRTLDAGLATLAHAAVVALAASIGRRDRARALLAAIAVGGASLAAVALVQRAHWNGRILGVYRPADWTGTMPATVCGPFVNPNHLASHLLLVCGAIVGSARLAPRRAGSALATTVPMQLAVGAALVLVAGTLLATGSRSGSALLVAAGVGLVAADRRAGRRRAPPRSRTRLVRAPRRGAAPGLRRWPAAAVVLFAFAVLVVDAGRGHPSGASGAFAELDRVQLWTATLRTVGDRPWLGSGAGGWSLASLRHIRPPLHQRTYVHAHAEPLELLVEVGALGALVLVGAAVFTARRLATRPALLPASARRPLGGALLAVAGHGLVESPWRVPGVSLPAAAMLGLLLARAPRAEGCPSARGGVGGVAAPAAALLAALVALGAVAPALAPLRLDLDRHRSADAAGWAALAASTASGSEVDGARASAERAFRTAVRLAPRWHRPHAGLALATGDPAEALAEMEVAVALNPAAVRYREQQALLWLGAGDEARAAAALEESFHLEPRAGRHRAFSHEQLARISDPLAAAVARGMDRAATWIDPAVVEHERAALAARRSAPR